MMSPIDRHPSRGRRFPDAPAPVQVEPDDDAVVGAACGDSNAEVELKLLCDPARLDDVLNAPQLDQYAQGKPDAQDLVAIYYDTSDFSLAAAGVVLRVRTEGDGPLMTVKSKRAGAGKALERAEWTVPVAGSEPDLAVLAKILPAEALARIEGVPLLPVFATEVARRVRLLTTPRGIVELVADKGRIVAGNRSESLCEIELELKAGRAEALFELARDLMAEFPLRPSVRSKSARGFDLARGVAPEITRARKLKLKPGSTLDETLDGALHAILQHWLESQPAAEDGRDPEGLHQYRIALRRLRSVLDLVHSLAPSPALEGFRAAAATLMSELADARDWDVFATATLPAMFRQHPDFDGAERLARMTERHRRQAHDKARAALLAPETGRFQIALGLWIEQKAWRGDATGKSAKRLAAPAGRFATRALHDLHRKALKHGRHFKALTPPQRHKLRIRLKKLRYAAEFLLPLFARTGATRRYLKSLSRLQDRLGHANDMAVVNRLAGEILATRIPRPARLAVEQLLEWRQDEAPQNEPRLRRAWKRFKRRRT